MDFGLKRGRGLKSDFVGLFLVEFGVCYGRLGDSHETAHSWTSGLRQVYLPPFLKLLNEKVHHRHAEP